jgi:hypothetical protein
VGFGVQNWFEISHHGLGACDPNPTHEAADDSKQSKTQAQSSGLMIFWKDVHFFD